MRFRSKLYFNSYCLTINTVFDSVLLKLLLSHLVFLVLVLVVVGTVYRVCSWFRAPQFSQLPWHNVPHAGKHLSLSHTSHVLLLCFSPFRSCLLPTLSDINAHRRLLGRCDRSAWQVTICFLTLTTYYYCLCIFIIMNVIKICAIIFLILYFCTVCIC